MMLWLVLLLASPSIHFDIADARGKRPGGVTIEAGAPDADGWFDIHTATRGKGDCILIWPYDGRAKAPDGPGGIPVIAIERGDPRAPGNGKIAAALLAGKLLGVSHETGFDPTPAALENSDDPFIKGVGLLADGKAADALDPLSRALKERERQLTRVPSEIYPVAMLYGKALVGANKFDDAALAFLKALRQRPSDPAARKLRVDALIKAGKAEAAENP